MRKRGEAHSARRGCGRGGTLSDGAARSLDPERAAGEPHSSRPCGHGGPGRVCQPAPGLPGLDRLAGESASSLHRSHAGSPPASGRRVCVRSWHCPPIEPPTPNARPVCVEVVDGRPCVGEANRLRPFHRRCQGSGKVACASPGVLARSESRGPAGARTRPVEARGARGAGPRGPPRLCQPRRHVRGRAGPPGARGHAKRVAMRQVTFRAVVRARKSQARCKRVDMSPGLYSAPSSGHGRGRWKVCCRVLPAAAGPVRAEWGVSGPQLTPLVGGRGLAPEDALPGPGGSRAGWNPVWTV